MVKGGETPRVPDIETEELEQDQVREEDVNKTLFCGPIWKPSPPPLLLHSLL